MNIINYLIVGSCIVATLGISLGDTSKVVGCYYGSWAGYRNGEGKFEPENIDPSLCTHLFYTFVGITSEGGIKNLDAWNDLPSGKDYFGRFNDLRKQNPNAKTLVAIGGWNEGSLVYSQVANDIDLRKAFAKNAADFVQEHGFDGFDLDWEYPAQRGGAASDYAAYVLLLKELRSVFDERGGLLLTAAIGVAASYVNTSYDVGEISKYLDLINMMTYDLHGSWDSVTGHNSPMYKSKVDTSEADLTLNVNASVHNWLDHGAIAEKLVIGVATYGRSFTLADRSNTAIGAPAIGAGLPGQYTQESGSLGYNEICSKINDGWTVVWDNDILAPYAYSDNQWVGFDNIRSATIKAEYARDMGLAGVFIWSLETEDFLGICGQGKFPILNALNAVLRPNETTGGSSNTSSSSTSSTSTTTHPATNVPSTTIDGGDELCHSEGYVADPSNCHVFYYCQSNGNGGFIVHTFTCSGDLVYDVQANICNYPDQVPSCNK